MPSLFPGMNPYLEQPAFWASFHTRLLVAIADELAPRLRPNYYIEVETQTYQIQDDCEDELLVGIPDAAVLSARSSPDMGEDAALETGGILTQKRPQSIALPMPVTVKSRYLEVREMGSDAVITVLEVLSPTNKQKGAGRTIYERKRSRILGSASHLVEIDLLRGHSPMAMLGTVEPTDYRIIVSRSQQRPQADLYGFSLREPIPGFPLPLKPEDEEPIVDLQAIVTGVGDRARYDDRIDYRQPVPPPQLSPSDRLWVEELLQKL
ncbi:MAG: DUF4058 family protein [Cyanobacteria bacterium J055]|nr:MAG: DUF4058 family protein [Cyanobacteria bacterium J055]